MGCDCENKVERNHSYSGYANKLLHQPESHEPNNYAQITIADRQLLSEIDWPARFKRSFSRTSPKYAGVFLESGILSFENHESFKAVVLQLENEILQSESTNFIESDDGPVYDREYPTLDKFEFAFGFTSLRQNIEFKRNQDKEQNLDVFDSGFEDDEVLTSFLNVRGEFRIGNSFFVFYSKSQLIEIINADYNTLKIIRNNITPNKLNLENVILHNLEMFETAENIIINNSGHHLVSKQANTTTNSFLPSQSGSTDCAITGISISQSQALARYATFTATVKDLPVEPLNPNPGSANFLWEIFELNQSTGATSLIHSNITQTTSCYGCSLITNSYSYQFPKEGFYKICVSAWNNYCKTQGKFCENFYINDLVTACCKWWDWNGRSTIYKSDRALRAELTIRNYPFFARIKASSANHKVSNGNIKTLKKRADKMAVGLGGEYHLFACQGAPHSILLSPNICNNKRKCSIAIRSWQPTTIRKLQTGSPEIASVHQIWDGGKYADIKLLLPTC